MNKMWLIVGAVMVLSACRHDSTDAESVEKLVRGLKTVLIQDVERSTVRRFPSVLQPASVSSLSFEVAGKIREITLKVDGAVKSRFLMRVGWVIIVHVYFTRPTDRRIV